MKRLIEQNPFRILGVFSNSSQKDILKNISRLNAYLKVGKNVDFPTDYNFILSPIARTVEMVQKAASDINLPADKIKYALFWFIKDSPIDDIALNHFTQGDVDKAMEILSKRNTFSSLLNRGLISFLKGDMEQAVSCYSNMLHNSQFGQEFILAVCGENFSIAEGELSKLFIDSLLQIDRAGNLIQYFNDSSDVALLKSIILSEYTTSINNEISAAKSVSSSDAPASLTAANKLVENTKATLSAMRSEFGVNDIQYQTAADNVAKQIMQCTINYFNNTDDSDAIDKAIRLQKYSTNLAVGKLTRERCQKNLDTLLEQQKTFPIRKELAELTSIIDDFTGEQGSFQQRLAAFANGMSIPAIRDFVARCSPILQAIKSKADQNEYLRLSTVVASIAMGKLIDKVNSAQRLYPQPDINSLKETVSGAMSVMTLIGNMDMEPSFRTRYNENLTTLRNIDRQVNPPAADKIQNWAEDNIGCVVYIVIGIIGLIIAAIAGA